MSILQIKASIDPLQRELDDLRHAYRRKQDRVDCMHAKTKTCSDLSDQIKHLQKAVVDVDTKYKALQIQYTTACTERDNYKTQLDSNASVVLTKEKNE
jgi:chromosome segregation ATPase